MMTKKGEIPEYDGPTPGKGTGGGRQEDGSGEGVEGKKSPATVEEEASDLPAGGSLQGGTTGEDGGVRSRNP